MKLTCSTATGREVIHLLHPATAVLSLHGTTNGFRSVVTVNKDMCVKVSSALFWSATTYSDNNRTSTDDDDDDDDDILCLRAPCGPSVLPHLHCVNSLYYGLEVCHYTKSRISALQYVLTSCFGKIFNTRSKDIISECMYFFNCSTISDTVTVRKRKFFE